MKITPLDIQQVAFKIKMRGYDRQEVDSFLDSLTEDYEELIRDNNRSQEKIVEFENQVSELKKKESTLNNTLMKAQDLVENMKQGAQKDADLIIKEAELKAEAVTRAGREDMAATKRHILDLKKQKMLFTEKVQSAMRLFQRVIDMDAQEEAKANSAQQAPGAPTTEAPQAEDAPSGEPKAVRSNP